MAKEIKKGEKLAESKSCFVGFIIGLTWLLGYYKKIVVVVVRERQ